MGQAVVPIVIAVASAAAAAGAGALLAPKPTAPPKMPTPPPTRTSALSNALSGDRDIRRRQGAAATIVTGSQGAEAPSPGAKALLGQ